MKSSPVDRQGTLNFLFNPYSYVQDSLMFNKGTVPFSGLLQTFYADFYSCICYLKYSCSYIFLIKFLEVLKRRTMFYKILLSPNTKISSSKAIEQYSIQKLTDWMKENMVIFHKATQYRLQKNNYFALRKLALLFKLWAVNSSRSVFSQTKFI